MNIQSNEKTSAKRVNSHNSGPQNRLSQVESDYQTAVECTTNAEQVLNQMREEEKKIILLVQHD